MKGLILILIFCSWGFSQTPKPIPLKQKVKNMNQAFKSKKYLRFKRQAFEVLIQDEKNFSALNKLGVYHLERGRLGLARIIFERALKHHPKKSPLHHNLGLLTLKEGDKGEAILFFEKSLDYNSGYLPSLLSLSSLYMENYDLKAKPLLGRAYQKLSSQSPLYSRVASNYAVSLAWSREFNKAQKVYQDLVKNNQASAQTLVNYAELLLGLKKISQAREMLGQARVQARSRKERNQIKKFTLKLRKGAS